ncbi:MAG: hypothetical protein QGF31_01430, partial [Nitrospinota bacterium]|nr:hypothetical protein [Nitrospinota bacterium]
PLWKLCPLHDYWPYNLFSYNIKPPRGCNHNSVRKTELDGFRRKATRRVEAMDGRANLSFADNQKELPLR